MHELESLQNIFKDRIFKIPDYQRGYAWTIRQLEDFWEDTVNLPPDRFHYTGLLSLKRVDKSGYSLWNEEKWLIEERGYKPFHVVDGQQRLTTFVIFIQAICELIEELPVNKGKKEGDIYLGSYSLKEIKEAFLVIGKPPHFLIRTYKFGYESDNPSFRFLRHRILYEPDGGSVQETFYTLNLENAKKFFKENLRAYNLRFGLEEVEVLFKKLTQNLMFNVYEISDDFDVYVAFETMNNRGKKLSNLELLKNRLVYLTTLYEEDELKTDERISLREGINEAWKEVYYQLGRNKLHPLNDDDFMVAHWIMYFHYSREKGDDYIRYLLEQKFTPQSIYEKTETLVGTVEKFEEIREGEDNENEDNEFNGTDQEKTILQSRLTPAEIKDYIDSLKSAAVHWYNTFHPVNNSALSEEEQLWIDRLNRIGIMYFRPLVTASYLSDNVSVADRIKLFMAIERFIFLAFRLSRSASTYRNSEFYRLARLLARGEANIDAIVKLIELRMDYCFYTYEGETNTYFEYSYFQKFIDRKFKSGGGFYNWNGLRYFLYEYEMDKVQQRGSQKIDWRLFVKGERDRVSIEHIYPQTPEAKCWKKGFKGYSKHTAFLQGTLGNLVPLSQSINSSLQNSCFSDKKSPKFNEQGVKIRQGYSDGSHSEIEVAGYEDWNPEAILDRGMRLLKFMEQRWGIVFEDEQAMADTLFLKFMFVKQK